MPKQPDHVLLFPPKELSSSTLPSRLADFIPITLDWGTANDVSLRNGNRGYL